MELQHKLINDEVHKRVGHITVAYKHFILVWAGLVEKTGSTGLLISSFCPSTLLWIYDCLTDTWACRNTLGDVPTGRSGCSAVLHDDKLYVFGGIEEGCVYSNKLYELNLLTLEWAHLEGCPGGGKQPLKCDKSVGWYFKQKLYFFGGYGLRPTADDDIRDLHFVINNQEMHKGWNNQFVAFDLATKTWIRPKMKGDIPGPRAAHSADISGHLVYVFGGRTGESRTNELFQLNLETYVWSQILSEHGLDLIPSGRSWHTFNFISKNRAILYGGLLKYGQAGFDFWECNIDEQRLNVCWQIKSLIEPLCWHQAAYCATTGDLVIVGGVSTSPYEMEEKDHVQSMIIIHNQPKSLFRLSMDVIVDCKLIDLSSKIIQDYFPKTLLNLLRARFFTKINKMKK